MPETTDLIIDKKVFPRQKHKQNVFERQAHKQILLELLEQISNNERQKPDRETIMKQWDYWRQIIATGDESSAPRDWFESVLDMIEEQR